MPRDMLFRTALGALALALAPLAAAVELSGAKTLTLHGRDGRSAAIGSVVFEPQAGGAARFKIDIDHGKVKDHFLSMREFKCVDGDTEILCHVPYPYAQPGTVQGGDYRWLEHALLFLYKEPRDFGAKLRNGLYFRLEAGERGLVGTPQAIDLTAIGAPPDDLTVPPYKPALRDEIRPGARWVTRLTID